MTQPENNPEVAYSKYGGSDLQAKILAKLKQSDLSTNPSQSLPYGIVDPDYARVYTQARIVAWSYGYACLMHGSFTRDLDLLLVPWTDQARDNGQQMLKLIAAGCGLRFRDGKEDCIESTVDFSDKPNGRKSCSLYFPAFDDRRWIDISIVPLPEIIEPPKVENLVRYCCECGSIGEVPIGSRDCCPDGSHAKYIDPVIAEQAQGGFNARLASWQEAQQKTLKADDDH